MTRLCPECGNPPAYTSFCTLCAQLFMDRADHFDRDFSADYLSGATLRILAAKYGMSRTQAHNHRVRLGLPPRACGPKSTVRHLHKALA